MGLVVDGFDLDGIGFTVGNEIPTTRRPGGRVDFAHELAPAIDRALSEKRREIRRARGEVT